MYISVLFNLNNLSVKDLDWNVHNFEGKGAILQEDVYIILTPYGHDWCVSYINQPIKIRKIDAIKQRSLKHHCMGCPFWPDDLCTIFPAANQDGRIIHTEYIMRI